MSEYQGEMTGDSGVVTAPPGLPSVALPATYAGLTPPHKPLAMFVILPERAKQRRWTVLVRVFLAIPLAVVTIAVGIAAEVCVVVGWFAALVIGRTPKFVRTVVTAFLQLSVRLGAYSLLLTDRFPPFTMDDVPQYGVCIAVPPATRMNRAAVLFRLILVIPAAIVARLVELGVFVLSLFAWVAVLITGWLPKPVHGVFQAFIRYEMRVVGYLALLVPTYPGELFGDFEPADPSTIELDPGAFEDNALSEDPSTEDVVADRFDAPPQEPSQSWFLLLGNGARRLLAGVIILGIVASIGLGALNASLNNHANMVQLNNQLVGDLDSFGTAANNCQTLTCVEQAYGTVSQQLGSFVSSLESANHAGVSQDLVNQMITAAQNAQRATGSLADAGPSSTRFRSLNKQLNIVQVLTVLQNTQHRFVDAINGSPLG